MRYDLPNYLSVLAVLPAADVAATANGSPIDLSAYVGKVMFRIDCGNATAGTNPTLDLKFKESTDNGNWTNAANCNVTQITNGSTQVIAYDLRAHGRYVRLDKTIGGANSPAFPCSVVGLAQLEYNPS